MSLSIQFIAVVSVALLACGSAVAQPQVAPPPHLALDELAKEYKRFGLPLPPKDAELVRVKRDGNPDQLGFRMPVKPGGYPNLLIGVGGTDDGWSAEPVKPEPDALRGAEPRWVSDWICLAIQCHERGWDEFASLLYARAREAISTPVPAREKIVYLFGVTGSSGRLNGWELHTTNSSALKELRHIASGYWSHQVMASDSDRKEVLRHLKELAPGSEDVRDLELTLAPRKSKPGTPEALIDDLTDYWESYKPAFEPLDATQKGEAAYRKLVEMGFDAVPALLDAVADRRLTRNYYGEWSAHPFGVGTYSERGRVWNVASQILNDLSGRQLTRKSGEWIDEKKARAWWEKAQKEGEEKWLVATMRAEDAWPSVENGNFSPRPANVVAFRLLGAKYPARLGEFYRTSLRQHPEHATRVLAGEVAASKLPRADKLALLVEGAEHKQLTHRVAALDALAQLDPNAFRKHLLAALKHVSPDAKDTFPWTPEVDLAGLVHRTDDPTCWDAVADAARRVSMSLRSQIIIGMLYAATPEPDKIRHERIRFLMKFLTDESFEPEVNEVTEDGRHYSAGTPAIRDVAAGTLARVLALDLKGDDNPGPLSRLFVRAAVAKAAAEELARLKK